MVLLDAMIASAAPALAPDTLSYSTTICACACRPAWPRCLALLREMCCCRLLPTLASYRCAARACGYGGNWRAANHILAELDDHGVSDYDGSVWSATVWACQVCGMPGVPPAAALDYLIRKELALLEFVQQQVESQDMNAVIRTIEQYALE